MSPDDLGASPPNPRASEEAVWSEAPEIVEPIFNPSGKVDIPVMFMVSAGSDNEILLDFDAALSVKVNTTGGVHPYILRPVINAVGSN